MKKLLPFRLPSQMGPRVRRPGADAPPRRRPPVDPPAEEPRSLEHPAVGDVELAAAATADHQSLFAPPEGAVLVPEPSSEGSAHLAPTPLRRGRQAADNVVPFRRRRAVRRLKRHPLIRWLQPFSMAVVIVILPVVVAAWLLGSPRFALGEVQVSTGERVNKAWVEERMGPFHGRNLLLLPLEQIQERLRRHPWVATVSLRKEPPSRLHVRIEERREVALLRRGSALLYLDTAGSAITPFEPTGEAVDLVLISQRSEDDDPAAALAFLRELEAAEVPWIEGLSEIRMLGQKDFKIFTTKLPFPLLVRGGTVENKARRLETLLPQIVARYGSGVEVDLRFARRIIVQPGPRVVDTPTFGASPRSGVS